MEKILPQHIESEQGVLGSLIIDPEAIVEVSDILNSEDFYRDAHRIIYAAMERLYTKREPADLITLPEELEREHKLEDVGGFTYLLSLENMVPTSANATHYAKIVAKKAAHRRRIRVAGQIASLSYEEADDAQAHAEQLLDAVDHRGHGSDFTAFSDVLLECMNEFDEMKNDQGGIIGVPTGYKGIDRLLGGMQRSDLLILAARPGVGKCLTSHTLIDNPLTGERVTIEDYVKRQLPLLHNLSDKGSIQLATVSHWIDSGVKPCYRVRTRLGREVEVTGHHPFLTVHGWIPLHDLIVGSRIAVPTQVGCFGTDEAWPLEKVRLLAYLIAEGGLTQIVPRFTNTDPVIVDDFKQCIANHFPTCAIRQHGIDYAISQPRNVETMRGGAILPKNPLTTWLDGLGLMGKFAKEKSFPACVWTWSRRYLAEFLRALMSCDGSIYLRDGDVPVIEFTVASKQLAYDLSHAFIRFGIIARFCQSSCNAWRVTITNPESVKRYQDEIGWIGEKASRFTNYIHKISVRGGNVGHAPKEAWELIRADSKRQGLSLTGLAYKSGQTTKQGKYAGYHAHTSQSISRNRLASFAETLDNPQLRFIASPDIFWDEIVSIEPIGEHQVYDLTVPNGANFIAQDVFVHNTTLAQNIAFNAMLTFDMRIAFFSLEMSRKQLAHRFIAMDSMIDSQRIRTAQINDDDNEWDKISSSIAKLSDGRLWIDDTAGLDIDVMRSKARRLHGKQGIDLIIVDYLQQMRATIDGKRPHVREQEVSEIARKLKQVARELDIPILALAQLSRNAENHVVPQLSDLRESGQLEQEADIVMFICRDEQSPDTLDVVVAKHRNGPQGTVRLGFEGKYTRFYNLG